MKTKIGLLVTDAFLQHGGINPHALDSFQKELERDGFDVTPGGVFAWNPAEAYCTNTPGVDSAAY